MLDGGSRVVDADAVDFDDGERQMGVAHIEVSNLCVLRVFAGPQSCDDTPGDALRSIKNLWRAVEASLDGCVIDDVAEFAFDVDGFAEGTLPVASRVTVQE